MSSGRDTSDINNPNSFAGFDYAHESHPAGQPCFAEEILGLPFIRWTTRNLLLQQSMRSPKDMILVWRIWIRTIDRLGG